MTRALAMLRQIGAWVLSFIRHHPLWTIELLVTWRAVRNFIREPEFRGFVLRETTVLLGGFEAAGSLLLTDTHATALDLARWGAKLALGVLPLAVLAWRLPRWEKLRLPLWAFLATPLYPISCYACPTLSRWVALMIASLGAAWLVRYRWLRWAWVLPVLVLFEPMANHFFFGFDRWTPETLLARCRQLDGQRPVNIKPEYLSPTYFGLSLFGPDRLLLTGQDSNRVTFAKDRGFLGGSWWLHREGDGWVFDGPSSARGKLWRGCFVGDTLWIDEVDHLLGVTRDAATGQESIRDLPVPGRWMETGEVSCDPEGKRVYLTESFSGTSVWEFSTETGQPRQLPGIVGGMGSLARRRNDGKLVAVNGSELVTYSVQDGPQARSLAGLLILGGMDVCPVDNEAVTADTAGRIRFFSAEPDGHYRFSWGFSMHSPRYVAYSPDCRYLAATSTEDDTVMVVDRAKRAVVGKYQLGPVVRGVAFLGERELGVTDACTFASIRF